MSIYIFICLISFWKNWKKEINTFIQQGCNKWSKGTDFYNAANISIFIELSIHKRKCILLSTIILKGSYNATCTFTSCLNWNVVGSVCTQPPYNDTNPPSVFFNLKSLPLSQNEPPVCVTSHGRRPIPRLLIDSSVSAQTALVSYLRPVDKVFCCWM